MDGAVLTVVYGYLDQQLKFAANRASDIANGELDFAAINNEYTFLTANAGEGIGETSMPLEQFTPFDPSQYGKTISNLSNDPRLDDQQCADDPIGQ